MIQIKNKLPSRKQLEMIKTKMMNQMRMEAHQRRREGEEPQQTVLETLDFSSRLFIGLAKAKAAVFVGRASKQGHGFVFFASAYGVSRNSSSTILVQQSYPILTVR